MNGERPQQGCAPERTQSALAQVSAKSKRSVECSTCLGSSFEQHGDDFICLHCGAIIDGPWPAWATEQRSSQTGESSDSAEGRP